MNRVKHMVDMGRLSQVACYFLNFTNIRAEGKNATKNRILQPDRREHEGSKGTRRHHAETHTTRGKLIDRARGAYHNQKLTLTVNNKLQQNRCCLGQMTGTEDTSAKNF
jgi:hypothetical protein